MSGASAACARSTSASTAAAPVRRAPRGRMSTDADRAHLRRRRCPRTCGVGAARCSRAASGAASCGSAVAASSASGGARILVTRGGARVAQAGAAGDEIARWFRREQRAGTAIFPRGCPVLRFTAARAIVGRNRSGRGSPSGAWRFRHGRRRRPGLRRPDARDQHGANGDDPRMLPARFRPKPWWRSVVGKRLDAPPFGRARQRGSDRSPGSGTSF